MGVPRGNSDSTDLHMKLMEHLVQYQKDMNAIGQDMHFLKAKLEELWDKVDGLPSDEQLEDGQTKG